MYAIHVNLRNWNLFTSAILKDIRPWCTFLKQTILVFFSSVNLLPFDTKLFNGDETKVNNCISVK